MSPKRPASHHGLVVVDKPAGWTSHDVVAKLRGVFGQRQVGHSGTLDPDATGVLLVGLGHMTRLLRFLGDLPKSYTGEVVLGTATSTLDASGEVVGEWDMAAVSLDDLRRAAGGLVGDIEQVPPMVSAVQVGGKRLHELAREGVEVERAARPVTVHRFEVAGWVEPGVAAIDVSCSSGTYVRTLAADLGTALGGGAHLRNLRRTAIGPFTVEGAPTLDEVGPDDVLPAAAALAHLPVARVAGDLRVAVGHGKVLDAAVLAVSGTGPWAVVDADGGALVAVYERHGEERVKPAVVLPPG